MWLDSHSFDQLASQLQLLLTILLVSYDKSLISNEAVI